MRPFGFGLRGDAVVGRGHGRVDPHRGGLAGDGGLTAEAVEVVCGVA
jgi:hypothetical protein